MNHAEYLESPLLREAGFRHGFFTRRGGVSAGPYESLNFSFTVGDHASSVRANLARAAVVLGVAAERLFFLSQVHGRTVHTLRGTERRSDVASLPGDGVVSAAPDLACCVRVADCVPVLIGCRASGVAAAVHAGWRGAVANVVDAAVARLRQLAGQQADLVAAIGPHIFSAAFEVSEQVAEALADSCANQDVVDRSRGPRPHVDLGLVVRTQLVRAGLDVNAVDAIGGCSFADPGQFFSYRRDGAHSGRHLAAIVPH
jgi:YfiH family protein